MTVLSRFVLNCYTSRVTMPVKPFLKQMSYISTEFIPVSLKITIANHLFINHNTKGRYSMQIGHNM